MPRTSPGLNVRQEKFIAEYLRSGNGKQSVILAGYSQKSADAAFNDLMKSPKIQKALAEAREEIQQRSKFDGTKAIEQAEHAAQFAQEHGNAMAYVKAVELKSKLSGLLIERMHLDLNVVSIDRALQLAGERTMPFFLQEQDKAREVVELKGKGEGQTE